MRDFLIDNNPEIIEKCINAFTEVNKLKEKTISSLVKEFLSATIENQRKILTLFLLMKDDIETQYLDQMFITGVKRSWTFNEQIRNQIYAWKRTIKDR